MKRLFLALSIVFILMAFNNESMNEQDEIEESFKADNPFLGTWAPVDGTEARLIFDSSNFLKLYINVNQYNAKEHNFSAQYTFDSSILSLSDIWNGVNHLGDTITMKCPYDFTNNRTFIFNEVEIKKISTKL